MTRPYFQRYGITDHVRELAEQDGWPRTLATIAGLTVFLLVFCGVVFALVYVLGEAQIP